MRPRKPLRARIEDRSRREGDHLIWLGQMRGGRPHLDRVGNPARILLDLTEHPDYQIRKEECDEPRCIDPYHYRVIQEVKHKYDDAPSTPWKDPRIISGFTARDLEEIEENLELLRNDEITIDDLDMLPEHIKSEILTRI